MRIAEGVHSVHRSVRVHDTQKRGVRGEGGAVGRGEGGAAGGGGGSAAGGCVDAWPCNSWINCRVNLKISPKGYKKIPVSEHHPSKEFHSSTFVRYRVGPY